MTRSWIVPAEHHGLRLDTFVRRCLPHLSRRRIEEAIRAKSFSVAGKAVRKGDRLASGDKVDFHGAATWLSARPQPENEHEIPLVYEDASMLIMNKPAGIPTHGFSARERGTLANFLLARWPELANIGTSRWEPGLVHRIDRDTSGLVLIAKTNAAFADLKSQFRHRRVKKTYWTLVSGSPPAEGLISLPLAHEQGDRSRMRVVVKQAERRKEKTWRAVTRYRTLGRSRGLSLLEIDMETGVTHQIRAHLGAIGHPIVADKVYGTKQGETFGLDRHFLHARGLGLRHPESGKWLAVVADLPSDLSELLERLAIRVKA